MGEELVVCSGGGECVGVGPGRKKGQLLVSFRTGAVQLITVRDLRLVCGWQLPGSELLACPAVACPAVGDKTHLYWAISSKLSALCWTEETTPTTATHQHIQEHPIKLLALPSNQYPLVVYSDGGVGNVESEDVTSLAPREGGGGCWEVVMSEVYGDNVCVVCVWEGCVSVGMATVVEGELKELCVRIVRRKTTLQGACLCGQQLWLHCDDGDILSMSVSSRHSTLHLVHTHHTQISHIVGLSHDHFIMVTSDSIQVWDALYCTCQQVLAGTSVGAKIWCVEECAYSWRVDGDLCGWRLEMGVASLAAALRKRSECVLPVTLPSWPASEKELLHWSMDKSRTLSDLTDPSKTPSLKSFTAAFGRCGLDSCYDSVIERLLAETRFWGREILKQLLEAGQVPSSVDVLGEIISRGDWSLALTCLSCNFTPSENVLADAILKVLNLPEEVESHGQCIRRKILLCKLLSKPFTDVLLQPVLASVPFTSIKELLLFLSEWTTVSHMLEPSLLLSCDAVVDWVSIVLDVFFTRLLLDQDSRHFLVTLQSNIRGQVKCFDGLYSLSSLRQVQSSWLKKTNNSLYKVEKIEFQF